jgi:tRNA (guanine10-N2)-dimethyltransferase
MTYTYRLAGENLELAEAELNGFLKSQGLEEKTERNGKLAETQSHPPQLKRLALTHEVSRKVSEASQVEELEPSEKEGSFAVRAEILSGEGDSKDLETKIGKILDTKKTEVDLENPEKTFKAYKKGEKIIITELVQDIDRGLYGKRKNQERPFSSPVSLDPVLARVLVNLSEVSAGETVLDPFCGTGGILIEAGLCGCGVAGLDVKEEMVKGTRENLEEYGIIAHDIREGEASETLEIFDADVMITDLPYGKASKKEGEPVQAFLELLEEFDGKAVFMWNEEKVGSYEADFSVYIHRNLTRYIYVI